MGSAFPPNRPISPQVMTAIHSLLNAATMSGMALINVRLEADRILETMPDCDLSVEELGAAIEKISRQHSFHGVVWGAASL